MQMCTYVYIHTCRYVHVYVYTYSYATTYIHTYICMYTHTYRRMNICIRICIEGCTSELKVCSSSYVPLKVRGAMVTLIRLRQFGVFACNRLCLVRSGAGPKWMKSFELDQGSSELWQASESQAGRCRARPQNSKLGRGSNLRERLLCAIEEAS